jgi:7,8-dihydropterin-6-yl-methyl-4-(beta-D-ribofuranosyl)aminobenzene 5'-phosphate synthase
MIKTLKITILVDNISSNSALQSEHGFSLWIEADNKRILFDTGHSKLIVHNAEKLGIDLRSAESLILSHGHYDHTGAIAEILRLNPSISIYCHPGILNLRFSRQPDGYMKYVGIDKGQSAALDLVKNSLRWINSPYLYSHDIGISGPIPRVSSFEDTGGEFFRDPKANEPDLIIDDLCLWFKTTAGLCIVTGCCHSGLVNTISHIQSITSEPVHTIIGGFHLGNASSDRIEQTCRFIQSINSNNNTPFIIPCHCTGENAIKQLHSTFCEKVRSGAVGLTFQIYT